MDDAELKGSKVTPTGFGQVFSDHRYPGEGSGKPIVMPSNPPFPNASIVINAAERLIWSMSRATLEADGKATRMIHRAALLGNKEFLWHFSFIERYIFGHHGGVYRVAIPKVVKLDVLAVGRCVVCDSADRLQVDHIMPVVLGGTNVRSNLQCLCWLCNLQKSGKHPDKWKAIHGAAAMAQVLSE